MSQPNFDRIANQPPTEYDKLSDEELRKLINDAARTKGLQGNIPAQYRPPVKKVIDLDAILGGE